MKDAKSIEREIKEKKWITPEELQNYYRLNVLRKNKKTTSRKIIKVKWFK